jgi:ABC-type Fe3+/spermidine/putrescine transport system ATPase subunit
VLEQIAAPEEIYRRPASEYVAKFIGQTNILRCRVAAGRAQCGPLIWPHSGREGNAVFSLRPECIVPAERIEPHSGSSIVRFHGQVTGRVFQGPTVMLQVSCGDLALLVRAPAGESITEHQEFAFRISDLVALGGEPA